MPLTAETSLAYLGFQLISPGSLLRSYVRSYWYFRREIPLAVYHEEYMHPQAGFGIVFNLGDKVCLDNQPIAEPVFLDGANSVSRRMGFLGQVDLLGVRFYEGGAYPFLGIPLYELCNALTLLDVLDQPRLLRLHARLREAPSLPARITLLEEWLLSRLALGKVRHALIPASLLMLRQREGDWSIPALAQEVALSQRQLERLYQIQVGVSPKQYARLLRVEQARLALKQMHEQTTTTVAADLGFYDQAHFIREFKAVIGLTPYAYMKRHPKQSK